MGPFSKLATGLSPAGQQKRDEAGLDDETASTSSMRSNSSSPPPYTEAVNYNTATSFVSPGAFAPTTQLQIHATGVTSCSSLSTQDPVPIPVFRVQPGSHSFSFDSIASEYVSLRIKRGSNSCALIRGSDPNGRPLNATVYRWGPGRAPRIRMFPPHSSASVEEAIRADDIECDVVEVRSRSIISRAQKVATPFGTFQWRYGSRSERKEAFGANSLLVLEKIDITSGGKTEKSHPRVAQLVRNEEFRTPGTNKFMAGNGGRLMIDLRMWADEKGADAAKVEAFIVASCICMLKKEVDRMRDNTLAAVV